MSREEELEQPPSYDTSAGNDVNTIQQPTIYVLAGQTIHIESPDSEPIYKLNRGIATLSYATSEVELKRVTRSVQETDDKNEPIVKQRTRHIYDIRHIKGVLGTLSSLPSDTPPFFAQPMLGKAALGLKKSLLRSSWKALPVDVSGKSSKWNMPAFVKEPDAKPLFEVRERSGRRRYEWTDGDSNPVAVEEDHGEGGGGEHRLVVIAPLHRETLDALVALWCCRLWRYSAEHQEPIYKGIERVRRNLALAKEVTGGSKMGIYGG